MKNWIRKQGKGHLLPFTDNQIKKLRECFNLLDTDGSGSIDPDDLEGPLIGLGFADSKEEINALIK